MRKYRAYHFTACTDSGYEFDMIMTEDDIINSDWGRLYFQRTKTTNKEECIKSWVETFMATEITEPSQSLEFQ